MISHHEDTGLFPFSFIQPDLSLSQPPFAKPSLSTLEVGRGSESLRFIFFRLLPLTTLPPNTPPVPTATTFDILVAMMLIMRMAVPPCLLASLPSVITASTHPTGNRSWWYHIH